MKRERLDLLIELLDELTEQMDYIHDDLRDRRQDRSTFGLTLSENAHNAARLAAFLNYTRPTFEDVSKSK